MELRFGLIIRAQHKAQPIDIRSQNEAHAQTTLLCKRRPRAGALLTSRHARRRRPLRPRPNAGSRRPPPRLR